ncbi:MAG: CocE/NonD family hydrolase, partial [Gammaproteobacteria bacterium]|nr:CocE/NonD family hydrolase [Gammaproteobacteria bacterium]
MNDFMQIEGARCRQQMVAMRDGTRLNTFVYLPLNGGPSYPVIVHRTPYGITLGDCEDPTDCTRGWLPSAAEPLRGSILRGWKAIVARGYAAVYQDTRGRYGSEGEDLVYGADAEDGADLLQWIAAQAWSNQRVGLSGSSAGATTALAAAASGHPSIGAFFAQVGGSSIYDDVVYEGQAIEMERLWLWVAKNVPGLSASHKAIAADRAGISLAALEAVAAEANACYQRLDAARGATPPFVDDPDWLRLPLLGHPQFSVCQPYLDEILSHPAPDEFRARHDFRHGIRAPGFHVTTWYDIFQTSVIGAFQTLQARIGNQRLWIGPNDHYFVYQDAFWPRDPYFEWFDHWLKDAHTPLVDEPPVHYASHAWISRPDHYRADDWCHAPSWPPPAASTRRLYLVGDASLRDRPVGGEPRSFDYDPRHPVPTLGGRNMLIQPGPLDQRPIQDLPGYGLMYTGEPLDAPLTLAGPVSVHLQVQSDCPDTDFVTRLIELREDGSAIALMEGVTRAMLREPERGVQTLRPDEVVSLRIDLGHIRHTLPTGCRLRVDVGSSNFPRRARNTNSGNLLLAADGRIAVIDWSLTARLSKAEREAL